MMLEFGSLNWETRRALKLLVLGVPMWTSHPDSEPALTFIEGEMSNVGQKGGAACSGQVLVCVPGHSLRDFQPAWRNFVQLTAE